MEKMRIKLPIPIPQYSSTPTLPKMPRTGKPICRGLETTVPLEFGPLLFRLLYSRGCQVIRPFIIGMAGMSFDLNKLQIFKTL